jgi:hypothetical protein
MRTPQSHTARENPPSRSALEDLRMPVQAKLAAAWTSFMFLYIYVDYLHLYKPGIIDEILAGIVFEFDISQTFVVIALTLVAIPILMILLSMTVPARANRTLNLVVASLYIPRLGVQRGRRVLDVLLRPRRRARGATPGLHPALCLDLAPPHRIAGDHGNQPGQGVAPHAAAGVTARPAPDHPSLAPRAGTVTCLSVRC